MDRGRRLNNFSDPFLCLGKTFDQVCFALFLWYRLHEEQHSFHLSKYFKMLQMVSNVKKK